MVIDDIDGLTSINTTFRYDTCRYMYLLSLLMLRHITLMALGYRKHMLRILNMEKSKSETFHRKHFYIVPDTVQP